MSRPAARDHQGETQLAVATPMINKSTTNTIHAKVTRALELTRASSLYVRVFSFVSAMTTSSSTSRGLCCGHGLGLFCSRFAPSMVGVIC